MSDCHRWLCIAYAFPPINRSGTHRTLAFARHLAEWNWPATVITADAHGEPTDSDLLDRVPPQIVAHRVRCEDRILRWKARLGCAEPSVITSGDGQAANGTAFETGGGSPASLNGSRIRHIFRRPIDFVTRAMLVPDDKAGWIRPAVRAGIDALRHEPPVLIYSTSPCASAHLVALALHRRTGLPWVADFRDPWRDNPFRDMGFSLLEWWDSRLERRVLRAATQVICNTPTARQRLVRRFPSLVDRTTTILNGFDAEMAIGIEPVRIGSEEEVVLTHCGQFYGSRSPAVWFEALRRAAPACAEGRRLRLQFIGERAYQGKDLQAMASAAGVSDQVTVVGCVSHAESMARASGSDAVALAGSSGEGAALQVPNKLFEYLALRRPILATLCEDHPGRDILREARVPSLVCRPDDTDALAAAMIRLARRLPFPVPNDWGGVEKFTREHRAEELLRIFQRATERANPEREGAGKRVAYSTA